LAVLSGLRVWIRSYIPGHWFGCSLRPGSLGRCFTHPVIWIHLPFEVIDPTYKGATTVFAQGRRIDNFLHTPDAESLPLYRMVLKLACVQISVHWHCSSASLQGRVVVLNGPQMEGPPIFLYVPFPASKQVVTWLLILRMLRIVRSAKAGSSLDRRPLIFGTALSAGL
jgi:hypothetical protein